MTILLTSGNPLGLRAVGSGGRTAVSSYEQITRTLRQTLGPAHAALFAEPSQRTATIDWFADVETTHRPVRLMEAAAGRRDDGLTRLETLVADIEAQAASLKKSDRPDERILGDMLAHALDIPDEDAVFLVGDQPVMTFWGYVKHQDRPAVGPIQRLMRRRSPPARPPEPETVRLGEPVTVRLGEPDAARVADEVVAPKPDRVTLPVARARPAASPGPAGLRAANALLGGLLAVCLLAFGFELVHSCTLRLPHALTGWMIADCPVADAGALADEQARQIEHRSQLDDLARQAALRRQACATVEPPQTNIEDPAVMPRPDPEPDPAPPPAPTPLLAPPVDPNPGIQQQTPLIHDEMKLPSTNNEQTDFLEGCWRAQDGLTEAIGDKDTGRKLKITYCFNKDGSGSRTIRYVGNETGKCVGHVDARWNGALLIDIAAASCDDNVRNYQAATAICRRGSAGEARCDQVIKGTSEPEFHDFPFTRTAEQP